MSTPTEWLQYASEDLQMAELAWGNSVYNQVCFHAQQCAEKTLKAWLVRHGLLPPRTHQIALLLGLCPRPLPFSAALEMDLLTLDRFYIPTRYPDALPGALPHGLPVEADAREALSAARDVHKVIVRVI
ncbi:MAG: HEPN domain-containing protein [Chloroflexota bacterium]